MVKGERELYFSKIDTVIDEVISLLSETINVNSIFLTNNDRKTNFIIKAFNRKMALLQEGESVPLEDSLCKLVIDNGPEPVVIPNIAQNPVAANLPGAEKIKHGSYIGAPISQGNDQVFGTICAADTKPYNFSSYDIKLIKTLGLLLGQSIILEDLMVRDQLTGLYNRSYLIGLFDRFQEDEQKYSLVYIDLDYFKEVNDLFGHEAGDVLLKKASSVFQKSAPAESIVARIGGDEFVLLVPVSSSDMEEAKETASRILDELKKTPIKINNNEFSISASIGMTYAEAGKSLSMLMNEADSAMYEAKRSGRNAVKVH